MLDKLFSFFSHDIGIDLGTANTLIWVRGKGIVIREPSIVAMHKKTKQVIAIGTEAKKMLGKTPASIITVRPLKGGVIADFDATAAMISHYIRQVHEIDKKLPLAFIHPKVAIGIPSAVTEVQRRAVWEAALSAGARAAYLVEEPMAAAIGAGLSVFSPTGMMVVDIGGGTSEIAVISLGGIVVNRSLKVAGDDMDQAILHYVRLRHGLLLGERTAEEIKLKIGSAYDMKNMKHKKKVTHEEEQDEKEGEKVMIVRGRDLETGLPKSLKLSESEVREALAPVLSQIVESVADVLEEAPPELTADILERGILITGGGALITGIEQLLIERVHIPVVVAEDPLTTVVRGCGAVLEDPDMLTRVKVTGGLS